MVIPPGAICYCKIEEPFLASWERMFIVIKLTIHPDLILPTCPEQKCMKSVGRIGSKLGKFNPNLPNSPYCNTHELAINLKEKFAFDWLLGLINKWVSTD